MKKLFIAASFAAVLMSSCSNSECKDVKLSSNIDSVSYAIGMSNGKSLSELPGDTINTKAFKAGFEAAFKKDSANLLLTDDQIRELLDNYNREIQTLMMKEMADKNKAFGDSVLNANKANEGVVETESGLQYRVITKGTGKTPTAEDKVKVNYTGKLLDGRTFDSSIGREPAEFNLNGVIKGWTEVLQLMPVGSKYEVWIPSDLAYGDQGNRFIEPGSTLYFEIELLDILPADK